MDAKKYPALTATLVVFGLVALTGVVLAGIEYAGYSKASEQLAANDRKVAALLKEPVALTAENKKAAEDNLAALKAAEVQHRQDLAGIKGGEFSNDLVTDPGQFVSNLNASVTGWRKALADAGIPIIGAKADDFAFGFSRYYKTGVNPPLKYTPDISRQSRIVDFLVRTLVDIKGQSNVRLLSVDREPVELPSGSRTNTNRDEITGLVDPTFRHEGIVRGEFFRVGVIGSTDVARRFVNAISGSGRPVIIRGVEVGVATPEQLAAPQAEGEPGATGPTGAPPANIFGDAPPPGAVPATAATAGITPPAAPTGPQVVVTDAPSVVTITLEFIEPAKVETTETAGNPAGEPTK